VTFGIAIAGTGRAGMVAKEEVEVRNRFMTHSKHQTGRRGVKTGREIANDRGNNGVRGTPARGEA
jgi:hypothetical protein